MAEKTVQQLVEEGMEFAETIRVAALEALLVKFMKATGTTIQDVTMVYQVDGEKIRFWFEKKPAHVVVEEEEKLEFGGAQRQDGAVRELLAVLKECHDAWIGSNGTMRLPIAMASANTLLMRFGDANG